MIEIIGFDTKFWTFPGGERSVKITPLSDTWKMPIEMHLDYRNSDDLIDMMLAVNALKHMFRNPLITLTVPYFPFSRQDRVMTSGECFGLQVAVDLIKSCGFSSITTWDAHSDVLAGMFPAGQFNNIEQHELWFKRDNTGGIDKTRIFTPGSVIISPDAGALKKIYKLSKIFSLTMQLNVIEASKVRDVATGQIIETKIDNSLLHGVNRAIIVDDIVDYGRTFVELAKVIRAGGFSGKLILCVTHGLFSGGLTPFEGLIDEIYTLNNINRVNLAEYNKPTI